MLEQYIAAQEKALAGLRNLASFLHSVPVPESDVALRPNDGFGVIRRLVASLDLINTSINSKVGWHGEDLLAFLPACLLPCSWLDGNACTQAERRGQALGCAAEPARNAAVQPSTSHGAPSLL